MNRRKRSVASINLIFTITFIVSQLADVRAQGFSPIIDFPLEHRVFPGLPYVNPDGDTTISSLDVYFHIPQTPKGVIYFFHGSNGGARVWLIDVEQPLILREAVRRGFGVVSSESNDRIERRWVVFTDSSGTEIPWKDSPDTENFWRLHTELMLANNWYDENTPLFAFGFSNGAGFSSALGLRASSFFISNQDTIPDISHVVPLQAVSINGSNGRHSKRTSYDMPSIFVVGINDHLVAALPDQTDHPLWPYTADVTVEFSYNKLMAEGIDTELYVKPEETLKPNRFQIIPGIDSLESAVIYDSLKAARGPNNEMFLSDQDSMLFSPKSVAIAPFIPAEFSQHTIEIEQQLFVVYAEHEVLSLYKNESLDFFERYITATEVAGSSETPQAYALEQNYPNPFNPETAIRYQIAQTTSVRLDVFNLRGQRVATIVDTQQEAGSYAVSWMGNDEAGRRVPSGIYVYRLATSEFQSAKKLILLR